MELRNIKTENEAQETNEKQEHSLRSIIWGPYLGLIYCFISSIFLSLSSVLVKKITYMSPAQLSLVRNSGVFVWTLPIAVFVAGKKLLGPKHYRILLSIRGFLVATSLYFSILSYKLLPLAEAATILSTTPAMVMIGARLVLKETYGLVAKFALVLTFLGMLLSIRLPELVRDKDNARFTLEYVAGIASALCCVFCWTFAYVSIRKMSDVHFSVVQIYVGFIGILENAALTAAFNSYDLPHCGWSTFWVACVGFFGFMGHTFTLMAVRSEAVGIVSVVRFSLDIVMAMLFQVMLFKDYPDVYLVSGAVIVMVSVSSIAMNKWLQQLSDESKLKRKLKFILL